MGDLEYGSVTDLNNALKRYFQYYNNERPHQLLSNATPAEVYTGTYQSACGTTLGHHIEMGVDKLMDDPVDNLLDNSASCPQVNTQVAHDLINDRLSGLQK